MIEETEKLLNWLKSIKFDEYYTLFQNAAYDLQTVSRMTPEDLTAIGITEPEKRRKLKNEINKLNIEDGIPNFMPSSLDEWLNAIRLTDYVKKLKEQGYTSVEKILELTWEDLEEIGIKKLESNNRHNTQNGLNSGQLNHYSSASSLQSSTNLNSSLNSLNSSHSTASKSSLLHNNLYLPLQAQPIYGILPAHQTAYQEVAINTNRNSTKLSPIEAGQSNNTSVNSNLSLGGLVNNQQNGTPTTPELKTFQPLSTAANGTNSTNTTNVHPNSHHHQLINDHQLLQQNTNGSISSSSNSLASSLNNSSNSAMNLPPLLVNGQISQYAYLNGHQVINGAINSNGQLLNGHHQIMANNGHPQLQPQVLINRGRSMESLSHHPEPIYGIRQLVNGQITLSTADGQQVPIQVIYANPNQLQQQQQQQQQLQQQIIDPNTNQTIYLQPQQQQQNSANEMYLILNNDMDGTATLNRPKSLIKNRPVAKIAAVKTQDLNGMTNNGNGFINDDNISEQKQAILTNQQIYDNLNGANYPNGLINNTVIANNMINANMNNGIAFIDNQQIYENNAYLQQQKLLNGNGLQDRNSYIYATLKRNKKVPPPIPKRTNSMRTGQNGQPQLPLTAPTTPSSHQPSLPQLRRNNSLDDAQNLLNHQLNQLALAQKLKQQLNQRSSCSSLETMQEEVFASCVKSLTSRFSMNSSSFDDDLPTPPSTNNNNSSSSTTTNGTTASSVISHLTSSNNKTNDSAVSNNNNSTTLNSNSGSNGAEEANKTKDKIASLLTSAINPPTDSKNNQLANSLSSNVEKLNLVNDANQSSNDKDENSNSSAKLNQSTGSGDFPPPPSPSVLLSNSSTNDSCSNNATTADGLQHPIPTITPPLPSPPVLNQLQQTSGTTTIVNKTTGGNNSMPTSSVSQHQPSANLNNNSVNNVNLNAINRTLTAQFTRQQQFSNSRVMPNQIFKFDNDAATCKQTAPHHMVEQCTVSSSSSTESMPFANDNVGTMRPRPNQMNGCAQLKQFASSSSSSSICSVSSLTSSSTSSSLSSVSSNVNALNNNNNALNGIITSSLVNSNVPIRPNVQPVQLLSQTNHQNVQPIVQQTIHNQNNNSIQVQHQSSPHCYQPSPLPQSQPQYNGNLNGSNNSNISNNSTSTSSSNHHGNTIENVVRTSVNCISNLSNHLSLSKLIASNPTTFRLLGKPVQPPQVPARPSENSVNAAKNWPCSPVKKLTSPEHVPNINQISNGLNGNNNHNSINVQTSNQQIIRQVANLKDDDRPTANGMPTNGTSNEVNNTISNSNHDNFRSQQTNHNLQSSLNEYGKYHSTERSNIPTDKNVSNGYSMMNGGNQMNSSLNSVLNTHDTISGSSSISSNNNTFSSYSTQKQELPANNSSNVDDTLNSMDDIEQMLANLSTQLDAMLTQAIAGQSTAVSVPANGDLSDECNLTRQKLEKNMALLNTAANAAQMIQQKDCNLGKNTVKLTKKYGKCLPSTGQEGLNNIYKNMRFTSRIICENVNKRILGCFSPENLKQFNQCTNKTLQYMDFIAKQKKTADLNDANKPQTRRKRFLLQNLLSGLGGTQGRRGRSGRRIGGSQDDDDEVENIGGGGLLEGGLSTLQDGIGGIVGGVTGRSGGKFGKNAKLTSFEQHCCMVHLKSDCFLSKVLHTCAEKSELRLYRALQTVISLAVRDAVDIACGRIETLDQCDKFSNEYDAEQDLGFR